MTFQLGILDQSPILEGLSVSESLQYTVHLAKLAEAHGFTRYWVAEHHNTTELAGSSPEVLAAHILANTNSIRVGSGGVMLQHYEPYKVAENFNVLVALNGNRIDLGVGSGPGGLLKKNNKNDASFEEKLVELQKYTNKETKEHQQLKAAPITEYEPELILLGASRKSAHLANKYNLPYAFTQFFNATEEELIEAEKIYHNGEGTNKHFILAVSVVITENEAEKEIYLTPTKVVKAKFQSGKTITFKSEEQAQEFIDNADEPVTIEVQNFVPIAGTVQEVQKTLEQLAEKYKVDEFLIHLASNNKEVRERTITELSKLTNKEKAVAN